MEKLLRKMEAMEPGERAKLQKLLKEETSDGPSMDWMYKTERPDTEEYLLGRRIDKHIEELDKAEEKKDAPGASFQEVIARRADMDMQAKMREDPLYAIRLKEEEAKRKLLQNPVKMKQLEKLMKERQKKMKKNKKKKKKKKHRSDSDDSDDDIVNKYLAILEQKKAKKSGMHEDSNQRLQEEVQHRREHQSTNHHDGRSRERQSRHSDSDTDKRHRSKRDSSSDDQISQVKAYGLLIRGETQGQVRNQSQRSEYRSNERSRRSADRSNERSRMSDDRSNERSRRSDDRSQRSDDRSQRSDDRSQRSHRSSKHKSRSPHRTESSSLTRGRSRSPHQRQHKKKLSSEEMARKRAEMMENARWRDEQREENVKRYRDEEAREREQLDDKDRRADFINPMMMKHADSSSVEDRINRNMHNVQRTRADLDKNFSKR